MSAPAAEIEPTTLIVSAVIDKGRWAIGPCRFPGHAIIVQITGRTCAGKPTGRCVWGGVFEGREYTLDAPWEGAAWLNEGDAGWLDDAETECGVIRGGEFVRLRGEEAKAAYVAAVAG